jgi:hypothetical protein
MSLLSPGVPKAPSREADAREHGQTDRAELFSTIIHNVEKGP